MQVSWKPIIRALNTTRSCNLPLHAGQGLEGFHGDLIVDAIVELDGFLRKCVFGSLDSAAVSAAISEPVPL